MLEWRISSGTRTLESLWRKETCGSWWLKSGDPTVCPPRSASRSVCQECGGRETCYCRGHPLFALNCSRGLWLGSGVVVEQPQLLLLMENVLVIESHPFPFTIWLRLLLLSTVTKDKLSNNFSIGLNNVWLVNTLKRQTIKQVDNQSVSKDNRVKL